VLAINVQHQRKWQIVAKISAKNGGQYETFNSIDAMQVHKVYSGELINKLSQPVFQLITN